MSLWQCPGSAGFLSHFPLSFLLRDTDLGAFLCSPSGLQLFSGFMSLPFCSGPWVCDANRFCSPILGAWYDLEALERGLVCSLFQ